jgi:hypothetical protein
MGSRDVGGDELRVVASLEYLRIHLGIDGYVRVFTKACGDTVTRASGTWTYEQSPCSGDDCLFGPQYIVHLAGTDVLGQQDMKIYPELYYALVEDIQSGEVHVFGFREILHDCGG